MFISYVFFRGPAYSKNKIQKKMKNSNNLNPVAIYPNAQLQKKSILLA